MIRSDDERQKEKTMTCRAKERPYYCIHLKDRHGDIHTTVPLAANVCLLSAHYDQRKTLNAWLGNVLEVVLDLSRWLVKQ